MYMERVGEYSERGMFHPVFQKIHKYRIAIQIIWWALPALEAPSIFMITRHYFLKKQ